MNMNPEQTAEFVKAVKGNLPAASEVEAVIAAPAVDLPALLENAKGSDLKVAAENCYFEDEGAFTGETSPKVLKEMGVDYVVIGHSERRDYFHETDEDINKKAHAIFRNGLTPIICCGESLETREAGKAEEWVANQVTAALKDLSAEQVASLVIAYEPIWAIGTGKTATTEQAQEVCAGIRACIAEIYDEATAEAIRIQYGGSVNAATAPDLFAQNDIDGGLVGGASLKEDFGKIVNYK